MKKKVLVFGYSKANFGDDFFVYILAKKYTDIDFYIHIKEEKYQRAFKNIDNIHFLKENRYVDDVNIDDYDSYIYIGGSIFMESEYSKHEVAEFTKLAQRCKEKNKPLFYMTCNFGPYKTNEYLKNVRNLFELCEGVCLRDINSYEKFSDINSVSYAPDITLSYDVSEYEKNKNKKSIGISIINLSIRDNIKEKEEVYNDYIKRIVIKFAKRGYDVSLISFCAFEEDEKAIEKIMQIIPEKYKERVKVLKYEDNIETFIEEYSKFGYMVCTRFHSMILSTMLRQKLYNLSYSKKTNNVLKDLKLTYKVDDIDKINYNIRLRKMYFKKISKNKLKKIRKAANKQFEAFEKWNKQ